MSDYIIRVMAADKQVSRPRKAPATLLEGAQSEMAVLL